MLQTLLWSWMTCSSTFLKYILAVLAQTSAACIFMYWNAFSTNFTAVHCFQLRKKVLRLDATSYQRSDRTFQHLCLWLQNEHEWQFCEEFAPLPGGTNDNDAHACEPNYIIARAIIGQRGSLPVTPLGYLNFKKVIFRTMRTMRKQFPVNWLTSGRFSAPKRGGVNKWKKSIKLSFLVSLLI